MKLTIQRKDLAELLAHALRCVSRSVTLPILNHVRLEAAEGALVARTTDFEVGIEVRAPADVEAPGAVTLPARPLAAIVNILPGDILALTVDDKHVATLTSLRSTYEFRGLSATDFPTLPDLPAMPSKLVMDGEDFDRLVSRVAFACSRDETRYILGGALLHADDEQCTVSLTATDIHRMARATLPLVGVPKFPDVIIPRPALVEMARIAAGSSSVAIRVSKAQAELCAGDIRFTTRLVEGVYPNFERVIPREFVAEAETETAALAAAVRRLVAAASTDLARIVVRPRSGLPGLVEIALPQTGITGECTEEIEGDWQGEPIAIAFNGRNALQHIHALGTERVRLRFSGELSPLIIDPVGDDTQLHIIMPMGKPQSVSEENSDEP